MQCHNSKKKLSVPRALNILFFFCCFPYVTEFIIHRVVSLCQQWLLMGLCRGGGLCLCIGSFPLIKLFSLPPPPFPCAGLSHCRHMIKVRASIAHMVSTDVMFLRESHTHRDTPLSEAQWREFMSLPAVVSHTKGLYVIIVVVKVAT